MEIRYLQEGETIEVKGARFTAPKTGWYRFDWKKWFEPELGYEVEGPAIERLGA